MPEQVCHNCSVALSRVQQSFLGNYLFCQQCITAALQISKQRLVQQRCMKRKQYQKPVVEMSKENARAEKFESFVLSNAKQKDLRRMFSLYISRDMWPEFLS